MVVCKYFLKGACRFGNACRFDHTLYDTGTSVLLHPSAATAIQNQSQQNVDTETLVKSVRTDMLNLEKGGQWLLSAYTPFKEKPPFDGFEDKSFEEIRFGFYEANKAGKLEEFKRQWQMMLQDAIQKIRALQNPPTEVIKTLVNIYNSPAGTNSNVNNQGFAQSASGGFFAQKTNASPFAASAGTTASGNTVQQFGGNVFAKINSNLNASGQNASIFGGQQTSGNSVLATNPSIFQQNAMSTSNNASPFSHSNFLSNTAQNQNFAQNSYGFSPFQQQQQQSQNLFSQTTTAFQNTQQANSPFRQIAQNPSPFSQNLSNQQVQQNPSPFAAVQNPSSGTSPFASVQNSNLPNANLPFAAVPNASSNIFRQSVQPSNNSPFANAAATGNSPFATASVQSATNVFKPLPQQITNLPSNQSNNSKAIANIQSEFYSKKEGISEEDTKHFQSPCFSMGKIPLVAPPQDLCF